LTFKIRRAVVSYVYYTYDVKDIFDINKSTSVVAPAVEQVPQLYSPLASSIASQWYSAIAE
jgi:hypothetical protein